MNEIKDIAIVVKKTNYKEKDLILSLISKNNGRFSISARGVRGGSKRFAGGIDLFDCGEIIVKKSARSSNLESLNRVESWSNFSKQPKLYSIASACLETIIALTEEEDTDSNELFLPLFLTLRALNKSTNIEEQNSILSFFLLCSLNATGFGMPVLRDENTQLWFTEMQNQNKPIIPNHKECIEQGLKLLISQVESIKGKRISSLS